MSLSVTVLGCAGSYAGPGNACSGYLIRGAEATLVVDLGPGTLANLQGHVDLADLDAVVLTHQHPDHWLDLPILRNALRYYLGREGLPVYGTAGTKALADAVIGELEPTLDWTTLGADTDLRVGDLRLRFSTTDHPVETLAVRIEDSAGHVLAYTADTGSGWSDDGFLAGADLLLCEATMTEEHVDQFQHLTGRQAGELAHGAGVDQLVITHVPPTVDPEAQQTAAAAAFDSARVALARVGDTYTL